MNDQERLDLAERMVDMTDEESLEFLNSLPEMPEAEDLAKIQSLIEDIRNATEVVEDVTEEDVTEEVAPTSKDAAIEAIESEYMESVLEV